MGKTAIDAGRGQATFKMAPHDPRLRLIGKDTPHKAGEHVLYQDRVHEAPDEGLVLDMMANGFRGAIDVRRDGEFWDVVVGRRRLTAAREAEQRGAELMIEVRPWKGTDLEAVEFMISENALRKDPSPVQMAVDLNRFLKMGATKEQTSRAIGKTVQTVDNYLKILDLDPDIQEAINAGWLTATAGIELSTLPREEQKKALKELAAAGGRITVKAAKETAKAAASGEERIKAPGKRLLSKLLADEGTAKVLQEADTIKVLRWYLGELSPKSIAGLTEAIRYVEEG